MKKTIKHLLDKRKLFIGVCLGITLLFTLVNISDRNFVYDRGPFSEPEILDMPFGILYLFGIILSSIIPVKEFKFKTNKIMVDQAYSLPIKRDKYYLSIYIVGLIEVLLPIIVCGLFSIIYVLFSEHAYNLWIFIPYILVLLIFTSSVYSIFVFFFNRGNTVLDGIVNMLFASFFLMALNSAFDNYLEVHEVFGFADTYFIFAPFSNIYTFFNNLMKNGSIDPYNMRYSWHALLPTLIYVILGVASVFLTIIFSKKEKAEDATQITESWFSYKTFIPAYLFLIMFGLYADLLLYVLMVLTAGFIGYVMYRRTVKIKKIDLIILFASTFVGLILGNILYSLK